MSEQYFKELKEIEGGNSIRSGGTFLIAQPQAVGTGKELVKVTIAQVIDALVRGGILTGTLGNEDLADLVSNVELVEGGLKITFGDGDENTLPITNGLAFDEISYDPETGYLHILADGDDVVDPCYIAAGGGGGGSSGGTKLIFAVYTPAAFSILDSAGTAPITYKFTSIDTETETATGAGNLAVYVGNVLKANLTVQQGDNQTVDVFPYLALGSNSVKLVLTDSYGASATRKFTIQRERFTVEWNLAEVEKSTGDLNFYITPTGSGTKTIYTYVDGTLSSTDTVTTSGRRLTKTITGLTHGAHTIEVYGTMSVGGSTVESNHLKSAIAQIGSSSTPVIAVNWPEGDLQQFTTAQIAYVVVNPSANPATVTLAVDNVTLSTVSADQTMHVWAWRPMTSGSHTLAITCGAVSVTKSVTVTSIGSGVEEVSSGLVVKVDPATISSLSGWSYGDFSFTLSQAFDEINGGLVTDSDGVRCIRITAGDRLTLDYKPFAGDPRRDGLAMKIIYAIKDSTDKDAVGISCKDGGVGLECKANNAYLYGNQTTLEMSLCEDQKVELDINIEPDSADKLASMWESACTFSVDQYAANESYSQGTAQGITFGSDDADVYLYLFRAYNRDLTETEIKANFVADGKDGTEILARKNRNDIYDGTGSIDLEEAYAANPDAHFIVINAPRMTLGKTDEVVGTIDHTYVSGGESHKWSAAMKMKVQGTSSVEHAATAGPNINFELPNGITLEDGTVISAGYAMNGAEQSIPTKLLCWKKNIASQDHIINRACAEWYNRYQPSIRAARIADPRVRDCLESAMCVVFFHNTASSAVQIGPDTVQPDETIFFGLGNLCSNKDADEVFDYDDIVIEVKNNANDQVRFKSTDLTGNNWKNNYEFRYLNTDVISETDAKAAWQLVQNFVYETDYTAATNEALSPSQTVNGQVFTTDSAAYRKARWKAEAPSIFDMDTLYWHHNITLFFLLRDNRAKNMFWSRNSSGKWGLWFNWDNDTGLCRNNDGYVDIEPGYMDFDTLGTGTVFNAADNALFTSLRENNFDELKANYLNRESAGAWNIDAFYAFCRESQDAICESLWIEDMQHNAIRTLQNLSTAAYLQRATGKLRLHIKKALTFQKVLVDSYYIATAATAESTAFRGYTPDTWAGVQPSGQLSITTYTNMYVNILAGSNSYRVRATAGTPVSVDISASLNNTEIYFRHAPWIQDFGDMSGLYLGQFEASNLKRVKRLLIGSSATGYYNTNFTQASFENCKRLVELNLGGLTNANRAFDFSANIYLQTLYCKGSGVTGVTFARGGRLRSVQLNGLASLEMRGLAQLQTFSMENMAALTALVIEDCPLVDTYAIIAAATNLARVRLLDIDWETDYTAYEALIRLYTAHGIDDDGYDTAHGVVTGSVYFSGIGMTKYNDIRAKLTGVTFTYGEALAEYTVTFQNYDGTTLIVLTSESGGTVLDPVRSGLIETPTRTPTVDKFWTFYGWDDVLTNITENKVLTAVYSEYNRYYTVRFCDANGAPIEGQTYSVIAYGSCSYTGEDLPAIDGAIWGGWQQLTTNVTQDMDVMPRYITPTLPSGSVSNYDYLYSDDPNDVSAFTLNEFYGIIDANMASSYFSVGDLIKIVPNTNTFADSTIILQVAGFNHYKLADSNSFAKVVFVMKGLMNSNRQMNSSNTNANGWPATAMRTWLNNTVYPALPQQWKSMIKLVTVLSSKGGTSADIVSSNDRLFLLSQAEVGFNSGDTPYKQEVDADADNRTFALFTSNNARIKKTYNGTGTAGNWWLRSPAASSSSNFCAVNNAGNSTNGTASTSYGVAFGFCI